MQCVEFESRLNDLSRRASSLRVSTRPCRSRPSCAGCCELLSAHESLLEGVAAMPVARLRDAQRHGTGTSRGGGRYGGGWCP